MNPFKKPTTVARHLKIAVTGKSGTGKTVFGLAARGYGLGRVAVLSNEAGDVHYLSHKTWGGFDRLPTQEIAQLEAALDYLEGSSEYGVLVIDTITGIYESLVDAKSKEDGSVQLKDWGLIKRKWKALIVRLNNLPMHVISVVHESDIVEMDGKGGSRIVGQKLDAEKTFERNPDILIRLGMQDGKRVARILKDRTGTFQSGELVEDPNVGMWRTAIKTGAAEAHVSLPSEVSASNEATMTPQPAPVAPVPAPIAELAPHPASAETPGEVKARLLAACAVGWRDWEEKRAWSKKHRASKDALPQADRDEIAAAFAAAHPQTKPTTTQGA